MNAFEQSGEAARGVRDPILAAKLRAVSEAATNATRDANSVDGQTEKAVEKAQAFAKELERFGESWADMIEALGRSFASAVRTDTEETARAVLDFADRTRQSGLDFKRTIDEYNAKRGHG